jgi:hypothetical protein
MHSATTHFSEMCAGSLSSGSSRDLLFIGTAENVQAHDVQANMDVFNKAVPNGVDALLVGPVGPAGERLLLVASSLAITGINAAGGDVFWCVSNDVVTSLAFCDIDCDGRQALLASSVSCDVHVYREVRHACTSGLLPCLAYTCREVEWGNSHKQWH